MKTVFFSGTVEDWEQIEIDIQNAPLSSADIVFASLLPGDVNFDDRVNADDALQILRYVDKLPSVSKASEEEPDPKRLLSGDMDGDGAVTRAGAVEIQRYAIGLRAGF